MNYLYSFCPSFNGFAHNIYPIFSPYTQQLQPTNLLIPSFQLMTDSALKNDRCEMLLQTQVSSLDQLSQYEAKKQPRVEKKPAKKEIGRKKDQNFGWRNQNKDRNCLSAILKSYIQYTLCSQEMIKLIENLIKKLNLQSDVSAFLRFVTDTFPTKKSYVGIKHMREVLTKQGTDKEVVVMLGVSLKYYLQNVYPLTLYQGSKLKKKIKLSLLKKARIALSMLFQ